MSERLEDELFEALKQHDLERVRSLLSRGADPNATDDKGWHPLHHAVGQMEVGGSIEFVKLLLQHGADPNAWDKNHYETPLLAASDPIDVTNFEGASILLEAGADPNVIRSDGESPLRMAAQGKALHLAQMLLKHGASKTIDDYGGDRCWTALGHAAYNFDIPMIRLLLDAGANPEREDDVGDTARDKLPPRETSDPALWDEVIELLGRSRT